MLNKIGIVAILALVGYGLFTLGDIRGTANFKGKLDSLDRVNDSLYAENLKDDSAIAELRDLDLELQYQVDHQKAKVLRVKEGGIVTGKHSII